MRAEKKFSTALSQEADVKAIADDRSAIRAPWMLAGRIIVDNCEDYLAGGHGLFDSIEEADEFLLAMAGHATTWYVQSRKLRGE